MIASYPLVPSRVIRQFLADIPSYGGCSGSPVYICYSNLRKVTPASGYLPGMHGDGIIGVVTSGPYIRWVSESPDETSIRQYTYGVTYVVPSQLIMEVIDLLPR
jgi:hypothetical protein